MYEEKIQHCEGKAIRIRTIGTLYAIVTCMMLLIYCIGSIKTGNSLWAIIAVLWLFPMLIARQIYKTGDGWAKLARDWGELEKLNTKREKLLNRRKND